MPVHRDLMAKTAALIMIGFRIAICLALDITEVELVAEVARVKGEWAVHGLPPELEMPKTLAVIYAAFCGAF